MDQSEEVSFLIIQCEGRPCLPVSTTLLCQHMLHEQKESFVNICIIAEHMLHQQHFNKGKVVLRLAENLAVVIVQD